MTTTIDGATAVLTVADLLQHLWDARGTDLLLTAGSRPLLRVNGQLTPLESAPVLTGEDTARLVEQVLTPAQSAAFGGRRELDFSFTWQDARVRGNAFHQRDTVACALRLIPSAIPTFDDLGLPPGGPPPVDADPGPGPGDRPDRVRQVDDARVAHRPHQHPPRRATS